MVDICVICSKTCSWIIDYFSHEGHTTALGRNQTARSSRIFIPAGRMADMILSPALICRTIFTTFST